MMLSSTGREDGFTLIEVLVATAILSTLVVALAQFFVSLAQTTHTMRSRARINENVTLALHKIMGDLNNTPDNGSRVGGVFEFIGVDGDGTFEDETETPHDSLSNPPHKLSDRLHFHRLASDFEIRQNSLKTERVYTAYWVNGENSPVTKDELRERWGILRRNWFHEETDGSPTLPTQGGNVSPLTNLTQSSIDLSTSANVRVLVPGVDYLSFRYRDSRGTCGCTDDWCNEWNTTDDTICPKNDPTNRLPGRVQVAIRGYETSDYPSERKLTPKWFRTTVSLGGQ